MSDSLRLHVCINFDVLARRRKLVERVEECTNIASFASVGLIWFGLETYGLLFRHTRANETGTTTENPIQNGYKHPSQ